MPEHGGVDDFDADASPKQSLLQRIRYGPRLRYDQSVPLTERLSKAFLKPLPPGSEPKQEQAPQSIDELETAVKSMNDKERLIGLLAAPCAGAIAVVIITALIANDPTTVAKHVSISLYHELLAVLLGLTVVMLVSSWFRKRLFLGIGMALYGLAVFNLHYWGFGVPFVMIAAWFLVRAYRAQRDLREATGERPRHGSSSSSASSTSRPRPNKRYTPPTR